MFLNTAIECIVRANGTDPVVEKGKEKSAVKGVVDVGISICLFLTRSYQRENRVFQPFKNWKKSSAMNGMALCHTSTASLKLIKSAKQMPIVFLASLQVTSPTQKSQRPD